MPRASGANSGPAASSRGGCALEAAAEERKVEAAAAAANLREQQAYDRGVRDGILMATDRQNQGRRRQAVTFFFFLDNFVVCPPLRPCLQEGGNRLSPPGFPLGPVDVN